MTGIAEAADGLAGLGQGLGGALGQGQHRLHLAEGDELVDRHLVAEQRAEELAVGPAVDAHAPGDRREDPAEDDRQREPAS